MKPRSIALGLIAASLLTACEERPARVPSKDPAVTVSAVVETAKMPDADDAADDPAIWVNSASAEKSLIVGTNKKRGLVVYRLDGSEVFRRDDGRMNNVDLRQDVTIGEFRGDLVGATNRDKKSIDLYKLEGETGVLTPLLSVPTGFNDPYGFCLYRNLESGEVYAFANNSDDGMVGQWLITADGTTLDAAQVRNFGVGSQAEGCAADDESGTLYVAEEDVGLYAYAANPAVAAAQNNERIVIDTVAGGHLTADAEGVTILRQANGGGYLIVSSQGSNSYNVYDRAAPHAFRGAFQIGPTQEQLGIDGVEETDGIDVTGASLGGAFAEGLFVAQDGFNYDGTQEGKRAHQNFKLVPWQAIREGLKLPPVIEPGDAATLPAGEPAPEPAKPN